MSQPRFLELYSASAGSGKTHAITREYLIMAFASARSFERILAVTFTNKAANEMKERILRELEALLSSGPKAPMYEAIAQAYPQFSQSEITGRARLIRDNMLHNYSFFQVGTIDSFVQQVLRAFTFELGLNADYDIEMNTHRVIEDITARLYRLLSDDPRLLEWMTLFAEKKIGEGRNWNFAGEIKALAREMVKEEYQKLYSFGNQIPDLNMLNKFRQVVLRVCADFENRMSQIAATSRTLSGQFTDLPTNTARHVEKYLTQKIDRPRRMQDYLPNATVRKAFENPESWETKSLKQAERTQVALIREQFMQSLNQAMHLLATEFPRYVSGMLLNNRLFTFGVIAHMEEALQAYRNEHGSVLISDANRMLRSLIDDTEAPYLYEKLGNRFSHILIDEFQDTSRFQWTNFKPLIMNSISQGERCILVGDIKQSIYRWRGGDWELLRSQVENDAGSAFIARKYLETNWRSLPHIVEFNNALFSKLPAAIQQQLSKSDEEELTPMNQGNSPEFADLFATAYADVYQKVPDAKKGGYVEFRFLSEQVKESDDEPQPQLEQLAGCIDELIGVRGRAPRDIAILVRTKNEGEAVVEYLMDYQRENPQAAHYDLLSSESLYIRHSHVVVLIINALRCMLNADDSIARACVCYQWAVLTHADSEAVLHPENLSEDTDTFPQQLLSGLTDWRSLSLFEIVENIVDCLSLYTFTAQIPWLQALQNCVLEFSRKMNADVGSFLLWWDEQGQETSLELSERQNAVKVMTIHKSKGLAFEVVLVPFCDWKISHSPLLSPILWLDNLPAPFDMFPGLPVNFSGDMQHTHFALDYQRERHYVAMDALNVLYVAFTRAVSELIVFATTDKRGIGIGHLIHPLITAGTESFPGHFDPVNKVYRLGEPVVIDMTAQAVDIGTATAEFHEQNRSSDWRNKIRISLQSHDFFIESLQYVGERVNYGTLMHEIMARIRVPADIPRVVEDMVLLGRLDRKEADTLKKRIIHFMDDEQIARFFQPDWEVRTETALLTHEGHTRIPDRILMRPDATVVVDFKFGEVFESHRYQVAEYKKLLREIGYPAVRGVLCYPEKSLVVEV